MTPEGIEMKCSPSISAMVALAAVLSAPVMIEALTSLTEPAALPRAIVLTTRTPTVTRRACANDCANFVVGASVYNDQNEMIGNIRNVLIGDNEEISGVVLSLGGFRGITRKSVRIPYRLLHSVNDKLVIVGATKDQLMRLPAFQYGSRS